MMFLVGGVVMIALITVIAKAFVNIEKEDTILRERYEELKLEKIKNKKRKSNHDFPIIIASRIFIK